LVRGEFVIQLLIILSLVGFSLETLPDLSEDFLFWLVCFEWFTVGPCVSLDWFSYDLDSGLLQLAGKR
jgi:hypothetical protein